MGAFPVLYVAAGLALACLVDFLPFSLALWPVGPLAFFLVADTQLYKRLCPSVRWLVGWSVVIELRMMKMHRILEISQIIASFHKVDAILHHS